MCHLQQQQQQQGGESVPVRTMTLEQSKPTNQTRTRKVCRFKNLNICVKLLCFYRLKF